MRIVLVSDIHGTGLALDAVLTEIGRHGYDRLVCLGDALQGGSEPARVVELLAAAECPVVLGNADAWLVSGESAEWVTPEQLEVREWTLQQIGEAGEAFIRSFVATAEVELEAGRRLLCFHGSPRSFDEVLHPWTPDDELAEALGDGAAAYAGGHTHQQFVRTFAGGTFLNPGSVGLAYNRLLPREEFFLYPLAEYAVLTSTAGGLGIELRHIMLDPDELAAADRTSGRPHAQSRYGPPRRVG